MSLAWASFAESLFNVPTMFTSSHGSPSYSFANRLSSLSVSCIACFHLLVKLVEYNMLVSLFEVLPMSMAPYGTQFCLLSLLLRQGLQKAQSCRSAGDVD